jgi:acyl-CoA dehydrogenase
MFVPPADEPGLGQLESALQKVLAARPLERKLRDAVKAGKLERQPSTTLAERGVQAGVLTEAERQILVQAEKARANAIAVDAFTRGSNAGRARSSAGSLDQFEAGRV